MKMKLNVNGAGLKKAALAHGEKVLFGAAFIALMLFGYSALTRPKLPSNLEPQVVRDKVQQAKKNIEDTNLKPEEKGIKDNIDFNVIAAAADGGKYLKDPVLLPPIADEQSLRDDPQVFAIEELRAGGGRGIMTATAGRGERRPAGAAVQRAAIAAGAKGQF